ncbi:DIS3-like exonuclease 2 [Eumeta japonica]|uniref:DIS3-like exonuclease 2 n=1 Tax=Eumeta variegata TaxID=151549 RepID=A0A4C1YKZ5_EUMVA|nr:DIS3-like exonuclease 2 [Eumeta japonica]
MSISDDIVERTMDVNRPSTSTGKQRVEQYRPEAVLNNIAKVNYPQVCPSTYCEGNQNQMKQNNHTSNNTHLNAVDDIVQRCVNMNVESGSDKEVPLHVQKIKKKNARKREKYKQSSQLQITQASQMVYERQTSYNNVTHNTTVIQEIFKTQIAPLYPSTNSSYFENLSCHPFLQYQSGNYNAVQTLVHHANASPVSGISTEPKSPQYFQNIVQHPLLSQTYPVVLQHPILQNLHNNISQLPNNVSQQSNKGKGKSKNKTKKCEEKSFEPYLTLQEVEEGLKKNTLLEGTLRINPKQYQHGYVSTIDRNEQDIFIDGMKRRNRALEGDIVIVELISACEDTNDSKNETEENKKGTKESEKGTGDGKQGTEESKIEVVENNKGSEQKRGKIVYIKETVHTRACIGNLKLMPDKNRQKALFVPRDHRIPRLNIPCTSWPDNFYQEAKNYENTLFLAKIIDWTDVRFAMGTIVCLIGQSGDMQSESKAILAQNDLDITPYGPEVRNLYPRLDFKIPEEEIKLREDCRKLCVFSIDPFNCRDIDDAVSCRKLENGNYEVGVHISDVTYFLTENTILDEKVAEKATTIYLVEKAYHMLPDELCVLCSLYPGVDKLTFSIFWEITDDGEVLNHRFAKAVINSCCQLAYEHAQAILENDKNAKEVFPELYNGFEYEDVYEVVKTLGKISAIFRKNRFEGGALRIDQPKVLFKLSASTGLPESYWIYENKESHQLIEEFMLLANMTVAHRLHEDYPKLAFLRCHPCPSRYLLRQLASSLEPMGIHLDVSSAGALYSSLIPHVGPNATDKGKAMVLNMLCAKPMTRAKYICADGKDDEDFHHYALNVPLYTHFTSPIRRYADIMVHRLLGASINYRETPKWEIDKVRWVAAQCNKQKYNAKKAGEMSTELYALKYIELNSPVTTEAVVVDVRDKYIDVIIVAMGLNRRIFFNSLLCILYMYVKEYTEDLRLGVRALLIIVRLIVDKKTVQRRWFPRTVELFDE